MAAKTPAYDRFIKSMHIGYIEWHDGISYDLDALDELASDEKDEVEAVLISRKNEDWRDTQALARIGSPSAFAAIEESTRGPNRTVRLAAGKYLHAIGRLDDLSDLICEALQNGTLGDGLAEAEQLASQFPSDKVKRTLLSGALRSTDGRAVRFVGILFYLYGKAKEPFDWSQRPFFLRFLSSDPPERYAVFDEMCQLLHVDPAQAANA
jgi:hypothetical protein